MFARALYLSIAVLVSPVSSAADRADEEFFEARVRPLLAKRCFECHRRQAEGGLRLDSRQAMLEGGNSGPAIVPGNAQRSLLIKVVGGHHDEISMPPEEPLRSGEIKTLSLWIAGGAAWPKAQSSARLTPDEHGITASEREFWSFQPLSDADVPSIDGPWGEHPIDAFVARHHREQKLRPVRPASPNTLIRRLSLDLTGLLPQPDEVDLFVTAFRANPETAYSDLVDALLSSRHYGERWAQHWLDLVRYADTAGDASDFPVPEAHKYRNYVIDALNNDKPYDQFVREQLAGDLMRGDSEQESWQRVIATGYIAISRRIGVSPHNLRHITIEDTLNNLGKTFLGLTIGCARCHDHKFDPIPTTDYYALYGIFDSTTYPHAGAEHQPYRSDFAYRMGRDQAEQLLTPHLARLQPFRDRERSAFARYKDFQVKPIDVPGFDRAVAWERVLASRDEIRRFAETFPQLETAYAVSESDAGDVPIQKQGEPNQRGRVVRRGFLQVLGGQTLDDNVEGSGRLELANWIAHPDNPLTARVIVNRIWHHHFGRGLVATTSDFGIRGERPSHPELLDFLANDFIDHGWSIKRLHRLIVHSMTYRLSSQAAADNASLDPENSRLWRANRRRMDAEQIRDAMLTLSDRIDLSPGTAHPLPHYLTYYYRQHEPFVANFSTNRRSIYLFRQRIRKDSFLELFDGSDGNLHLAARRPTTTSLQSLYFMNSPFVDQQAQAIAHRALEASDTPAGRITWAYRQFYSRDPLADEIAATKLFVNRLATTDSDEAMRTSWTSVVRAMLSSNEFLYID